MADYTALRQTMVDTQLRTNKVTDADVLAAMGDVPRELFVAEDRATLAYIDEDIRIGKSRCMVEPMILARMIQAAEVGPDDVVLDIACGAGYSSAVLGHIARAVVAVESDTDLAGAASARITKLGLDNVVVEMGPINAGWADQAPYDVIMINGACEKMSDAVLSQLAEGGRLCAIVGGAAGTCAATLFVKSGGIVSSRELFDASVPGLPEFELEEGFTF
ncbi:MAG: protein-L-isoaspartate O-methyltransferase [Rhodospirillaceae bacterium]|jgi:protein-L-isoaspartate(D-aspartate) O-methyltransferase|nr:protein-L-isoaspartate O-methyltransferase [Rhodospirillaceae bacterium]